MATSALCSRQASACRHVRADVTPAEPTVAYGVRGSRFGVPADVVEQYLDSAEGAGGRSVRFASAPLQRGCSIRLESRSCAAKTYVPRYEVTGAQQSLQRTHMRRRRSMRVRWNGVFGVRGLAQGLPKQCRSA